MRNFDGRCAVVTGGSRGIGRAVCIKLAEGGANIVFSYAGNTSAAEETQKAVEALGVKCVSVQADVSDSTSATALVKAATDEFGRVDILVNNAGITRDGLMMMMKEEDFEAVVDTNMKGTFLMMKAVSRIMMRQRYGRIVNISSVVGVHGNAGQVNYSASKAGIIGMTKSVAKELASRNITANAVAPGFIETDMTESLPDSLKTAQLAVIPMGKLGKAESVANAVAFLADESSDYITGQVLAVDGGMGM